jgi:hypothetical protein
VLGQLRAGRVHDQERAVGLLDDRLVDLLHQLGRPLALHAHHDAVRAVGVLDRRAFLEELRIGGHVEGNVGAQVLGHRALELLVGVDRHGALLDQQPVAVHVLRHLAAHLLDVGQVGGAAVAGRGAHRDEDHFRELGALFDGAREVQAAGRHVALDQLLQPVLVDGHLELLEHLDLVLVVVHAQHVVAPVRETGARHQSDIARAHHRNVHSRSILRLE